MSATAPEPANPYVGPTAFTAADLLYGRERETRELINLLIAERVVLLHAPSGAGKTSLIQARLRGVLTEHAFQVFPPMQVGLAPRRALEQGVPPQNRYLFSVLLALEEGLPAAERTPLADLARMDLLTYLAQAPVPGTPDNTVLIFDQFEEILTINPADWDEKNAFLDQLGRVLSDPNRWALFSLREDYLAPLDPLLRRVLPRFSTYRLDLLTVSAARAAIQLPARDHGVEFTDSAVAKLIDDLRRVRVQLLDGTTVTQPGRYVEPVQLQVVCQRVWEQRVPGTSQIVETDLQEVRDVDDALAAYYAQRVAAIAHTLQEPERHVRNWFHTQLITEQGRRGSVLQEAGTSNGLRNAVIEACVSAHLVRREERHGDIWYELAHDRLVAPIRADNTAWGERNLTLLQHQAALWVRQRRPAALLLRDSDLKAAQRWAKAHQSELLPYERDFLAESLRAHRASRNVRILGLGAILLSLLLLASGVILYFALQAEQQRGIAQAQATIANTARRQAEAQATTIAQQAREAHSRQLAVQSLLHVDDQLDLALLLGVEAQTITSTLEANNSLLTSLQRNPYLQAFLRGAGSPLGSVVFSPDGNRIAGGGCATTNVTSVCTEGAVQVWDVKTQRQVGPTWKGHHGEVTSVTFNTDGSTLASGSSDETVILWNTITGQRRRELQVAHTVPGLVRPYNAVESLAFSPDGRRLAAGTASGLVYVWDAITGQPLDPFDTGARAVIWSIAFSPDGRLLAAGSADTTIYVWNVVTRKPQGPLRGHTAAVTGVVFSPDGKTVLSGSADRTLRVWDVLTGQLQGLPFTGHSAGVTGVAFSPDGKTVLSGSADWTLRLWDVATHLPYMPTLSGPTAPVLAVAFSADGHTLVSSSNDGLLLLWDLAGRRGFGHPIGPTVSTGSFVAFSRDGQTLAIGTPDRILLWDVPLGQLRGDPFTTDGPLYSVAFSADGMTLAATGQDKLLLWDTGTHELRAPPLPDTVATGGPLAFSPDGKLLAVSTAHGSIYLWDVGAHQLHAAPLVGLVAAVTSLAFSPDGRILAAGACVTAAAALCRQGEVQLWDLDTQQLLHPRLDGYPSAVSSVAFSPDGRLLASGGCSRFTESGTSCIQGDVRVWDVSSQRLVGILPEVHKNRVDSVTFNRDGQMLASAGLEGIVLWNIPTRLPLGWLLPGTVSAVPPDPLFPGAENAVASAAFSPDGLTLASGRDRGPALLWNVQPTSWAAAACIMANRNLTAAEWQQYQPEVPYHLTCSDLPAVSVP
jgi:WD40 repeat protein